jgi:hypothetical protein
MLKEFLIYLGVVSSFEALSSNGTILGIAIETSERTLSQQTNFKSTGGI